jgi:competence protein ComEC
MAALSLAERYRDPGVTSRGEFLELHDLDARGTIKSPLLIERLDDEPVFLPLAWLDEWRARLVRLADATFSTDTAGVLKAAMLGNRYGLSRETAERFRDGGTFHILVISGLHIAFVGGLVWALARRFTRRRFWQWALSVAFVWAYAVGVGAEASVVRAALMFTVVTLAPVLSRRALGLNALGGACLMLLLWRPGELFDPSFQLTFLSVLMIVTIAWPLLRRLQEIGDWYPTGDSPYPPVCARGLRSFCELLFWSERDWRREMARTIYSYRLFKHPLAARLEKLHVQRLLRYAFGALVVSASVQVGLLPLLVLYFHRLSLASFFLNIIVGALMAALSLVALAALAVTQLSMTVAAPLIWLAEKLSWLMVHSSDPFARLNLASFRLPEYTGTMAGIYALYYLPYLILAFVLARWQPRRDAPEVMRGNPERWRQATQVAAFLLAVLLLLIVFHPYSSRRPDGRLHIAFLDVGQGDAALVTMPDGTTLLIDGGGRSDFQRRKRTFELDENGEVEPFERDARSVGEMVVSEYLWQQGLDQVDYILATHADADHIDGLNDVARNFRVRLALLARLPAGDPEFMKLAATLRQQGIPAAIISRGDQFSFGEVKVDVLWPPPVPGAQAPSANDDSIVLRLSLGQRAFLLTGDIEERAETALVSLQDDLRCDAVKVAHHGSKTSSRQSFTTAVHPELAVISVGLDSPYGHPDARVIERWRATGAEVLTTGERGTINISTDGQDLKVDTFKSR